MTDLVIEGIRARWKGVEVHLPKKLFRFVLLLAERPGIDVPFRQVIDATHATGAYPDVDLGARQMLGNLAHRVRDAFRAVDPTFDRLEAIRGFGYRWRA